MIFISIYYAPLHIALVRSYTIIVLNLPFILFHFFWNNHKCFIIIIIIIIIMMDLKPKIQCIILGLNMYLNNLIF
jgi:hypothetical protein